MNEFLEPFLYGVFVGVAMLFLGFVTVIFIFFILDKLDKISER